MITHTVNQHQSLEMKPIEFRNGKEKWKEKSSQRKDQHVLDKELECRDIITIEPQNDINSMQRFVDQCHIIPTPVNPQPSPPNARSSAPKAP